MKTANLYSGRTAAYHRFNPLASLTPQSLSRQLEAFRAGEFREIARTWQAIEARDDTVQSVAFKRKMAAARYGWEILPVDGSGNARRHRDALSEFFRNLRAVNAHDENERGGFQMLARQMMDAVGKRYAVHEIVWQPGSDGSLGAEFRFVPLWYFENTSGRLRFLASDAAVEGEALKDGQWMVTTGPGIMEASSVAFMYKHLPLRDWLIYCERNGMPGVRGVTDAPPDSPEWLAALEAVQAFGAEYKALMTRSTEVEVVDLSSRGTLPYPALIERMDRAIVVLWRGADLSTISRTGGVGASLQDEEPDLIADADASMLSEALNTYVTPWVTRHCFGQAPLARIQVRAGRRKDVDRDLRIFRAAREMGFRIDAEDFAERLSFPLSRNQPHSTPESHE
ncbi:MAG: DUF935 family protein [Opitutales bacterium]|nr:DUF935 family protein [Opitutales bacterium]